MNKPRVFKAKHNVDSTPAPSEPVSSMLYLVYFIWFFCGMTQCFETVFLPEFKQYFHLNYQEQMYTMFAKNFPFVLAVLIGAFSIRFGYKNCLALSMALYATGTFLLVPAIQLGYYGLLLCAFFIVGTGFTIHMVAGNPLLSSLGSSDTSSIRLNFGSALGAIAQILAPAMLTFIIPASADSLTAKLPYMRALFLVLGSILTSLAVRTYFARSVPTEVANRTHPDQPTVRPDKGSIWSHPKVVFGAITIFMILGTEAGLFGFFRNCLESPAAGRLSSHQSQRLFTAYFALFALGRLSASWIQRKLSPSLHIMFSLIAALLILPLIMFGQGTTVVVALLAIGFFVSILFPSLYAVAIAKMGNLTGRASGMLTFGFLGGAVLPVLQGRLADSVGLQMSYGMGLIVYLIALAYVFWLMYRRLPDSESV